MNLVFPNGLNAFLTKAISWTADSIKAMLVDLSSAGGAVTLISNVTNASPMVASTTTSHGYSNGDIVVMGGVGGNTAANGTWKIAGVTATTFQLTTRVDGLNSTGSGAYTSGGYCVDVTLAQFNSSVNGTRVGTDVALGSLSASLGVANAAAFTWAAVPTQANTVKAVIVYDATPGADASNPVIAFYDGKTQVYVDKAVSAADTSITVVPLTAVIPSGTTIVWSDGHSSTTSAQGNVGDRTLSINAQAAGGVAVGSTADVSTLSCGLPLTTNGGNIQFTPDTGTNKMFAI